MARREPIRALRALVAIAAATAAIAPAAAGAAGYGTRPLAIGAHGRDVTLFQRYLTRAGFRVPVDGNYGRRTAAAERRFERAAGRHVDGRASRSDQLMVRRAASQGGVGSARGTGGTGYVAAPASPGARATIGPDGRTAVAPDSAPQEVKDAIAAANRITSKPYHYGGGHGKWEDSGYDCSGSVSYALHGGGLLGRPLDSTAFESWGSPGAGQWITVYANSGHAYAVIAGLRFDTSGGGGESGPRWRSQPRSPRGYVARHPSGF